jgi:hypothetical protein
MRRQTARDTQPRAPEIPAQQGRSPSTALLTFDFDSPGASSESRPAVPDRSLKQKIIRWLNELL